ncbi:hypothetical protein R4I72_09025 [Leclercia adecarboxylata]|nr:MULTISPECIES: hypothetical protein [Leclercia]MDQ2128585.1 hypothetical protein [Leclercia adecarboxylata]MDV7057198.1 hypothetical protein [Leclercia adecarboxylata]QIG32513.1 hypothetical protein FY047_07360 [Leclercia adecarboxylata]
MAKICFITHSDDLVRLKIAEAFRKAGQGAGTRREGILTLSEPIEHAAMTAAKICLNTPSDDLVRLKIAEAFPEGRGEAQGRAERA